MIRRNTWILLILLAALVGFALYLRNRNAQQAASATPTSAAETGGAKPSPLFSPNEGQVTDVKIQDTTGKAVEIKRNAAGEWVLQAPIEAKADQAAAEAAATQVSSLQVISSVPLGFDVVGLDKPAYTMTIAFSAGKTYTLAVGAKTPIQDGYYTSLDKGPVRIVDKAGIDALVSLLSQPPYAATPVPTTELSSPTVPAEAGTATATLETTGTTTPQATPSPAATNTEAAPTEPPAVTPTP